MVVCTVHSPNEFTVCYTAGSCVNINYGILGVLAVFFLCLILDGVPFSGLKTGTPYLKIFRMIMAETQPSLHVCPGMASYLFLLVDVCPWQRSVFFLLTEKHYFLYLWLHLIMVKPFCFVPVMKMEFQCFHEDSKILLLQTICFHFLQLFDFCI